MKKPISSMAVKKRTDLTLDESLAKATRAIVVVEAWVPDGREMLFRHITADEATKEADAQWDAIDEEFRLLSNLLAEKSAKDFRPRHLIMARSDERSWGLRERMQTYRLGSSLWRAAFPEDRHTAEALSDEAFALAESGAFKVRLQRFDALTWLAEKGRFPKITLYDAFHTSAAGRANAKFLGFLFPLDDDRKTYGFQNMNDLGLLDDDAAMDPEESGANPIAVLPQKIVLTKDGGYALEAALPEAMDTCDSPMSRSQALASLAECYAGTVEPLKTPFALPFDGFEPEMPTKKETEKERE